MQQEKKRYGKKRLPKNTLSNIIRAVTKRSGLPPDCITKSCICSRLKNGRSDCVYKSTPGPSSPLLKYEPEFVAVIVQMARMHMALLPTDCIALMNSLIEGKQVQWDLLEFKKNHKFGEKGTVGFGYWNGFKRRNEHLICSKRGQKYKLNCDKWTTYTNFADMYNHVYIEMEDAGVAVKLKTPVWQDEDGVTCPELSAFGCKVTHTLTHPEMCFVMDKVGGNISQKGDGHQAGKLLVCKKGMEPQKMHTGRYWDLPPSMDGVLAVPSRQIFS